MSPLGGRLKPFEARKRLSALPIGVLVSFLFFAAACGGADSAPSPSGTEGSPSASNSPLLRDPNRAFLSILDLVPRFVGYWYDPETNTYNVNSRDPDLDLQAVRDALVRLDLASTQQVEGAEFYLDYTPFGLTDLSSWYDQVQDLIYADLPADLRPCLGVLDLDRFRERVFVGLTCEEAREWVVERVLEEIDAPLGAIIVSLEPLEDDTG